MTGIPAVAMGHYRLVRGLQVQVLQATRRAWARVSPEHVQQSWDAVAPGLVRAVTSMQAQAALAGGVSAAGILAEQDAYTPPGALTDPLAFVGWMVDDDAPLYQVPIAGAMDTAPVRALHSISQGVAPREALTRAGRTLEVVVSTAVADAARQAASTDLVVRPGVGWVRMLNPPSCPRCVVLAGRWYAWNQGFRRHPFCDCIHVACTARGTRGAKAEGLITDPYVYFESLSERDQDRLFTRAGAQAIRDGADIYQVVNARRGLAGVTRRRSTGGHRNLSPSDPRRRWTSEGTTRRGVWRQAGGQGTHRLTPEGVYSLARDRDHALQLLREHGYLLPQGQVAGGAIHGPRRVGYGQAGAGGRRRAASDAVREALATGQRDPSSIYTATAAERRVLEARRDWELALQGVDPWSAYAVELRGGARIGAPFKAVTQEQKAYAESHYRHMLATGGQIY